jgi:hypothetical protein
MRQCLTFPDGGYYTSRGSGDGAQVFGSKGDFVTSPEISQIFGELLGIWTVTEWMAQGKVAGGVELIEVGPGKGTLMDDMLRVSDSRLYNHMVNVVCVHRANHGDCRLFETSSPLHRVSRPYTLWRPALRSEMYRRICFAAKMPLWKRRTLAIRA